MLTSLTTLEAWLLYGGIVLGVILILSIIFYFTCGFRFKREKKSNIEHVVVDDVFIDLLIVSLGGKDNIKNLSLDNGRVKFLVEDLELLNYDKIKEVSTSGAFISGNNVKLLFKYDSELIVKTLNERGI